MSKGQDHTADDKIADPAPIADPPADPSINPPPPPPPEATDPVGALTYSIAADFLSLFEALASRVPSGFTFSPQVDALRVKLDELYELAHKQK